MPECADEDCGYTGFGYYTKTGEFDFSPGEKIVFNDKSVGQYFSALIKGSKRNKKWAFTTEWLAVRNPNSFTQAVLMDKNKENLLFKKYMK